MSLEVKINKSIKEAMIAKDTVALESLRAIKSEILLAKAEKGEIGLKEEVELKILQKLYKQRNDSSDLFKQQNRVDLANIELEQAKVIKQYLPKKMDKEELISLIKNIIDEIGATDMSYMGKVMGVVSAKVAGKADGKTISIIVKDFLK